MKNIFYAAMSAALLASGTAVAQEQEGYEFTSVVDVPTTSVKDQHRSGTCWSFSAVSFLESEMMRMGKPSIDLSEMYIVNKCYEAKGDLAVRMHGKVNFAAGGAAHDVVWVMENFGLMPEEAYSGLNYGLDAHNHGEIDRVLEAFIKAVIGEERPLTTAWKPAYKAVIDAYLGAVPEKFTFEGKEYTASSFSKEVVGLNPADYVSLASFTHHPFYSKFILEVPDNWLWGEMYNVTIDELVEVTENALKNGYSVVWGADVSEPGFAYAKGVAVAPETKAESMEGTERARWEQLDRIGKAKYGHDAPVKEIEVTQEMRQEAFDNYETTDDHGMHIVGIAKDQNGTTYYKVKNSWNTDNAYDGYLYASKAYFMYKTMDIMVHKDAIPSALKKKLGIK